MVIFESEFVMIIFIIQARKNKNTTNWTQFKQTKPGSKWTVKMSESERSWTAPDGHLYENRGSFEPKWTIMGLSRPSSFDHCDRSVYFLKIFICLLFDCPFSQTMHLKFVKPSNLSPLWPNFRLHCTNS